MSLQFIDRQQEMLQIVRDAHRMADALLAALGPMPYKSYMGRKATTMNQNPVEVDSEGISTFRNKLKNETPKQKKFRLKIRKEYYLRHKARIRERENERQRKMRAAFKEENSSVLIK